jgi:hypothetical protein
MTILPRGHATYCVVSATREHDQGLAIVVERSNAVYWLIRYQVLSTVLVLHLQALQ